MLFGLFKNTKKRLPNLGRTNNSKQKLNKSVFQSTHKNSEEPKINLKVFKPRTDFNLKQNLKPENPNLELKLGIFKPLKIKFDRVEFAKKINYFIFKYNLIASLNWLLSRVIIGSLLVILLYLTFFDTYFLVKNYNFSFKEQKLQIQTEAGNKTITSKSYLSESELQKVAQAINNNRFLGLIPNNQYWYLNQRNLLSNSQDVVPEISDLKIVDRNWPNGVSLEITTEPILATLVINENGLKKYYRVSQSGRIVTEDNSGVKEKLIAVDRRISFNQSNVTFKDYPLSDNKAQLNKIWFAVTVWQILDLYGLQAVSTTFPSMTDTELIITTQHGTRLFFESDTELIPKEVQENRIKAIFASNLLQTEKESKLAYIDFRTQNKKVFLCYLGGACNK